MASTGFSFVQTRFGSKGKAWPSPKESVGGSLSRRRAVVCSMAMLRSERVFFPNTEGGQLAGRLERPWGAIRAYALFAHCFTCSKDIAAASRISRALAADGIATLRFDFTGLGSSDGDFANTNFSSNVEDLVSAADWMRENYEAPQLLVGHSLGGAAVLKAARLIPESKVVVPIAAPSDPKHVGHHFADHHETILREGAASVSIAGRPFTIKRHFLEDLETHDLADEVGDLDRALLIMHAPTDDIVSIEHAARLYEMAKHPKSYVSLDGADHLLSDARDAEFVASMITTWADRFIDGKKPTPAENPSDEVVVRIAGERYPTLIEASGRRLPVDEPESLGGKNTGPTPMEIALGSLGSCTAITLRMYADRKKWPLFAVVVRLKRVEGEGAKKAIEREIELRGPLDDAQRARLLEIAERCPVHRLMAEETTVRSQLVDEASLS